MADLVDDGNDDQYEAKWRKKERELPISQQSILIKHHEPSEKEKELSMFANRLQDRKFEKIAKAREEEHAKIEKPPPTQFKNQLQKNPSTVKDIFISSLSGHFVDELEYLLRDQDADLSKFAAIFYNLTGEILEKASFSSMPSQQLREILKGQVNVASNDKLLPKIKDIVDLVGRYLIEKG